MYWLCILLMMNYYLFNLSKKVFTFSGIEFLVNILFCFLTLLKMFFYYLPELFLMRNLLISIFFFSFCTTFKNFFITGIEQFDCYVTRSNFDVACMLDSLNILIWIYSSHQILGLILIHCGPYSPLAIPELSAQFSTLWVPQNSIWASPPCPRLGGSLKAVNLGKCRDHFTCFPSLNDHGD